MKIPSSDLDGFAADVVSTCIKSRQERSESYGGFKHYYLFGAQEGDFAPYGKIYPHIDLLTAYLYSQATVQFDVAVDNQPDVVYEQASLVSRRTDMYFHDYGIADEYSEALTWALVYNSTFLKFNWSRHDRKVEPYFIQPHDFAVLNESVSDLNRQEAFVHCYDISRHELNRRLAALPNGADLMRRVQARPIQRDDVFPESVNRLIIAGTVNMQTTTTQGMVNVPDLLGRLMYKPRGGEDMVEAYELWVWDDDAEDYRTITLVSPGIVIYGSGATKDRGNIFGIKGEHPFIHVCPNRLYDYFFGWSEITGLIKLQDWATERLRQIKGILAKQANPPKAFSGFGGINDEKMAAFDAPGGWLSEQMPGAKVEQLPPEMPTDMFQEIMMIQNMFNDVSGLSDILQGKGEAGVRAKAHADVLAKLGSARIKKRAQSVEKSLEEIGNLLVRIMQAKDDHEFTLKNNEKFIAKQFPCEYQVHVDAHSASPVFVDDHMQLAMMLRKFGAIDDDSLIELTRPPKAELLKQRLKGMKAQRAQQQKQMAELGVIPGGKGKKQA